MEPARLKPHVRRLRTQHETQLTGQDVRPHTRCARGPRPEAYPALYEAVLGVIPVYQEGDFVQAQTPGSRDVLVFERKPRQAGKAGGVVHFGFRLRRAGDISRALAAIRAAGGTIRDHGEFVPGEPYVFFSDPDGYEVEIWYELPTPVDPPSRVRHSGSLRAARRAQTGRLTTVNPTAGGVSEAIARPRSPAAGYAER